MAARCSRWSPPSGCTTRSGWSTAASPRRSSTRAWAARCTRRSPRASATRRPTCRCATYVRWARTPGACSPRGASCTRGRRTATAEGRVFAESSGKLIAHGCERLHDPRLSEAARADRRSHRPAAAPSAERPPECQLAWVAGPRPSCGQFGLARFERHERAVGHALALRQPAPDAHRQSGADHHAVTDDERGQLVRFDVVERCADAHLLLRRTTRRRGMRSRGRRRRTPRTARALRRSPRRTSGSSNRRRRSP